MVYLLAIAVCVLPIQAWTDALPKYPGGINFQNLVTIALLIGWKLRTRSMRRPLLTKNSGLNKWMGLYIGWTFLALYYGPFFSPVGFPLSMSDDRFVIWKDQVTGMLMFFIAANSLRDEKEIRKLVFFMALIIPYVIGVYYQQYNSPLFKRRETFWPQDTFLDDDRGTATGVPYSRYVALTGPPFIDVQHRVKCYRIDERGDWSPVNCVPRHGDARVRLPGLSKHAKPFSISYYQDRRQAASGAKEFDWDLKRITGVFTQIGSNEMASFYVNAFLVFLGIVMVYKRFGWRMYLLANMLLLAYGIVMSLSRGAWLATLGGAGYLAVRRNRSLMILFVLLFLLGPALMPGSVSSRAGGGMDDSAESRFDFWKWAAVAGTVRYPLGVGYACYIPKHREETGIKLDTHNFFMRTIAEMGLLGLLMVLQMFRYSFVLAWRLYERAKTPFLRGLGVGVALMTIGSAIANMFGDRIAYISLGCYIWAFAGMAVRGLTITEEELAEDRAREDQEARQPQPEHGEAEGR